MKLSSVFLGLGILLLIASVLSFSYVGEYNECGSACEPQTWAEGINPFSAPQACTKQCVPGVYPTNMYLYLFYLAVIAFIIAIVFFIREKRA